MPLAIQQIRTGVSFGCKATGLFVWRYVKGAQQNSLFVMATDSLSLSLELEQGYIIVAARLRNVAWNERGWAWGRVPADADVKGGMNINEYSRAP